MAVKPAEQAVPAVTEWFASPPGQALLACEAADIDRALNCLFGYHLCQLSVVRGLSLTHNSRIAHTFALNPCAQAGGGEAGRCDFARLPLAPESVDVFVLHHALDFSQWPHQLLAEVARATIAHGHIVIVGFNPWSISGLWRALRRILGKGPESAHHNVPWGRLHDWCKVLDLVPLQLTQGQHWPRTSRSHRDAEPLLRRLGLPGGSYYCVTVRKEVSGAIPIKPAWHKVELAGLGVSTVPRHMNSGPNNE
jgi:hypothetical protein